MYELLSPSEMALADKLTIEAGTPGIELMENAGQAVVQTIKNKFPNAKNILIVCGLGNNGGDGFIAARHLSNDGLHVKAFVFGDISKIRGDARLALNELRKSLLLDEFPDLQEYDVIVDALFGAGLCRTIEGEAAKLVKQINTSGIPVVAVDLPSGIDGTNGQIMGCAIKAAHTVTFFRNKPGHLLFPGRLNCGKCSLHQIGIKSSTLKKTGFSAYQNHPDNWRECNPAPKFQSHKYDRGHALVLSGPKTATGAARLMAHSALRSGTGLVTVASPEEALSINAHHLTSIMLVQADTTDEICVILQDQRINSVALGPGMPPNEDTAAMVDTVLNTNRKTILDAGALSAFAQDPKRLFQAIRKSDADVYLTPHEGEFARLFPDESTLTSKTERTHNAAKLSGATIILKGADTVIATPKGQICISENAPPWLATAGSGDVLAGIVTGLAAQGMPAFEAACAAVWLHGDAANRLGPGLISSDLEEGLRQAIKGLIYALS